MTTLKLLTGLGAAGALAVGGTLWTYTGVGLFLLSFLLDRADGELARITGRTSRLGHIYDRLSDAVATSFLFVGIGIGLRHSILGLWSLPLGVAAGVAVAALFGFVIQAEGLNGQSAGGMTGIAGFDPDDALLVVPIAILLGGAVPLLLIAAVVAPAFALYMTWRLRSNPRAEQPTGRAR